MIFRQRAGRLAVIFVLAVLLLAAGCVKPYEPPQKGEPSALLKLQYVYSQIRPGTTLRVYMFIKEDKAEKFLPAYRQDFGTVSNGKNRPRVPIHALSIRPSTKSAIAMRLAFWWTVTTSVPVTTYANNQSTTTYQNRTEYYEVGCTSTIEFQPQEGKIYLINYNSPTVGSGCTANALLQTPTGAGKFNLKAVGGPYKEKAE